MPSAAEIAALRLPFGLPFGREHFVVIQILCKRVQSRSLRGTGGWDKPLNNHEVLAFGREHFVVAQRSNLCNYVQLFSSSTPSRL